MDWKLDRTDDMTLVGALYGQVFKEDLDSTELEKRKIDGHSAHCFVIRQKGGDEVGGFAIFFGRDQEVELWRCGVVSGQRRKGAGNSLLTQGIKEMAEQGYSVMSVHTFNQWGVMLSLLIHRGFRIVGAEYNSLYDDLQINLKTELSLKKEIRYALTEECNFKCVFCHNEGLGHEKRGRRSTSEILEILTEAVRLGYTDITLTGGEPLYGGRPQKERLYTILTGLGSMPAPPAVTMVTNGALLSDEDIASLLLYPGKIKIHVSLHAVDAESFAKVTQMHPELFDVVKAKIRRASAAGIKVKVNFVLLRGINHDRIGQAVKVARDMGAVAIKFVELMVLPESADDFGMYYDSHAILRDVNKIAVPVPCDIRRRHLFSLKSDDNFQIEVQKCTCAMGCSHCLELRDRTFSSDMKYHPCFVRDKTSLHIDNSTTLPVVLQQGNHIIEGYAKKYGDSSPTLIKQEQFVPGRREFFFKIDCADKFRGFLIQQGFSLVEKKGFYLEYYRPRKRTSEWDNFERVLKIGWDNHDQSKISMIYTDHNYRFHQEFGLEVTTRYLDSKGPHLFKSPESARRFLDKLDFEQYLVYEFNLDICKIGSIEMSLSVDTIRPTLKVCGCDDEVREAIKSVSGYKGSIEQLGKPLEEYIINNNGVCYG